MTTAQLITALIPTIAALLVYAYHLIFHFLPAKKREALKLFAPEAVQAVQQLNASASNPEKKALAVNIIKAALKDFKLPVPSDASIGTFIESAVYTLKQANVQVNAQSNVATNTTTIPASLVPPQWLGQPPTSPTVGTTPTPGGAQSSDSIPFRG